MKKLGKAALALVLAMSMGSATIAEPALTKADQIASTVGCDLRYFPFTMVDENIYGHNCPATNAEKAAGGLIFVVGTTLIVGHATGKISFPLSGF